MVSFGVDWWLAGGNDSTVASRNYQGPQRGLPCIQGGLCIKCIHWRTSHNHSTPRPPALRGAHGGSFVLIQWPYITLNTHLTFKIQKCKSMGVACNSMSRCPLHCFQPPSCAWFVLAGRGVARGGLQASPMPHGRNIRHSRTAPMCALRKPRDVRKNDHGHAQG